MAGLAAVRALAVHDVTPDSALVTTGFPRLLPLALDTNIDDEEEQVRRRRREKGVKGREGQEGEGKGKLT